MIGKTLDRESTCLPRQNAENGTAQTERNPRVAPFLSEGYKRGIQWPKKLNQNGRFSLVNAGIAQLVEQLICNQQVIGSSPIAGFSLENCFRVDCLFYE
ncbi:MAG: hypothetical protein QOE34_2628 [Verrucomicrobiota bacterium]